MQDVFRRAIHLIQQRADIAQSVVELGLYESTVRLNATLEEKGIAPGTPEWEQETEQVLEQQRTAMKQRRIEDCCPT